MLGVPREMLQRYLYGAALPEEAPREEVLPQTISDEELAAAMAEPPPADPMAALRQRYLEAQREGENRDAANAIASQFSSISSNLARNLGLSSNPIVQRQAGLADAPTRALERQLAQEHALTPPATAGRAAAAPKPMASNDPTSPESRRYQEAFKAQYPDAPAPLIGAITEANFDAFRKTLEAGAASRARGGAATASAEERKKDRELRERLALKGITIAEGSLSLREREYLRRIAEDDEDDGIKASERAQKQEREARGQTVPAGEAATIGMSEAALGALDDLDKAHATLAGGIIGGIASNIPGTDATKYDDMVLATAQAVGTILEGGKLAAGDEVKYRKMLPAAGDSAARRKAKIANVKKLVSEAKRTKVKALGQAGFNVKGFQDPTGAPATPPSRTPAATPAATPARETKKYSAKQDMTYVFDPAGKPIRTEKGDTRGQN